MNALRARWQAWWHRRLTASDHMVLTQRLVYILPSGAGFMLALTLLCMLLTSINFQLNMGYMLTFLLAGSALVSMHMGHANLRGLQLTLQRPQSHFFHTPTYLHVQLRNPNARARWGISLAVHGQADLHRTAVQAHSDTFMTLAWKAPKRGRHALPTLALQTRFPLGMFRVWALWRPASSVLVYPHPEPNAPPWPQGQSHLDPDGKTRLRGGSEQEGVRLYQRGDALKTVVWKKAAQAIARGSHDLLSRDTVQPATGVVWLDLASTRLSGQEAALSRLCAWVLHADASGRDYGLQLPGQRIDPSRGASHCQQCLEALALC